MSAFWEETTTQRKTEMLGGKLGSTLRPSQFCFLSSCLYLQLNAFIPHLYSWDPGSVVLVQENREAKHDVIRTSVQILEFSDAVDTLSPLVVSLSASVPPRAGCSSPQTSTSG